MGSIEKIWKMKLQFSLFVSLSLSQRRCWENSTFAFKRIYFCLLHHCRTSAPLTPHLPSFYWRTEVRPVTQLQASVLSGPAQWLLVEKKMFLARDHSPSRRWILPGERVHRLWGSVGVMLPGSREDANALNTNLWKDGCWQFMCINASLMLSLIQQHYAESSPRLLTTMLFIGSSFHSCKTFQTWVPNTISHADV